MTWIHCVFSRRALLQRLPEAGLSGDCRDSNLSEIANANPVPATSTATQNGLGPTGTLATTVLAALSMTEGAVGL
jgi:hypothetical protein